MSHDASSRTRTGADRTDCQAASETGRRSVQGAHLAVIMDGNGRWATARRRPRHHGHLVGTRRAAELIEAAPSMGLRHLTLYAFSSENWRRPHEEVATLMRLLEKELRRRGERLARLGVQVRFIGRRDRLPATLVSAMADVEGASVACNNLHLRVAIDYGGRDEIVRAVSRIAQDVASGDLAPEDIDLSTVAARLDTAEAPPPDIVLRSGGEQRLSNFLLWQSVGAIFVSMETPWPEFRVERISRAIVCALDRSPEASPGAQIAGSAMRLTDPEMNPVAPDPDSSTRRPKPSGREVAPSQSALMKHAFAES